MFPGAGTAPLRMSASADFHAPSGILSRRNRIVAGRDSCHRCEVSGLYSAKLLYTGMLTTRQRRRLDIRIRNLISPLILTTLLRIDIFAAY